METFTETTVGTIGDARIGVSNIWEREYELPDGTSRTGLTARLDILEGEQERKLFVGEGSVITIESAQWVIREVEKKGKRGTISLEPLDNP